jgi:hypothetical protein
MANKAKKTQKGNFGETFEKLINEKTLHTFTEEVLETNEFGYYMNSIQRLEIIELYDSIVDDVTQEYIQNNPKVKKISEKAKQNIRSLVTHMIFEIFDESLYNEDYDWNLTSNLLLNNYFFNEENVVAAVSASISKCGKEIESEVFRPTISAEKAYDKTHKLIGTTEWDNVIVPSQVKYGISKAKAHLELYMWDEFIKSEYNTYKLMGYTDEDITDILNSEDTIIGFCGWCEGYAKGVEEAKNK